MSILVIIGNNKIINHSGQMVAKIIFIGRIKVNSDEYYEFN